MPTYPLPTLAPSIDSSGIQTLLYEDIYLSLIQSFQAIYGSDIYIDPDSQDGQWLAILAQGYYDCGQAMAATFQSFSPTYAQGVGLSSVAKINGLQRKVASNSTAPGTVVGVAGTIINNGVVADTNGNLWDLPTQVIIPIGGSITETVTAQQPGSVNAASGSISTINTPQLGWQSFVSTSDATLGMPVENDAELRVRQTLSTSIAAVGIKEAVYSALGNVPGVQRFTIYENDGASPDGNGIPAHSFDCVVGGGSVANICNTIAAQKPPGIQTYGNTFQTVYDQFGLPSVIYFDVLTEVPIYFDVTIKALAGYVATTATVAMSALAAMINGLEIGEDVYASQAAAAASLAGIGLGTTFYIVSFYLSTNTGATVTAGSFSTGNTYVIASVGTTDFTLIGASANTVGVVFVASGAGTGTGTAHATNNIPIAFNAAATTDIADMTWTAT